MGKAKFALRMLKLEYQKTFFYGLSLVCSSAVIFLFFNYMDNHIIGNEISTGMGFSNLLSLAIMLIASATACFANGFFLSKKNEEIGIYTMSGAGVGGVSIYLIVQNFAIIIAAIPLGFLIGYLANPILNQIVYSSLHITGNLWHISTQAIVMSIITLLTQTAALTVVNAGYAYRHDILQLLHFNNTMKAEAPASSIRMPIIVYWVTALIPLYVFFQVPVASNDTMVFLIVSCIGLYGISGLFKRGLPQLFEFLQRHFNMNHKIRLIGFGNLSYSIARTATLIKIIIVAIICMICLCITYHDDPSNSTLIYFSYGVIIFLMTFCIVYRVIVENSSNGPLFESLYKLGFVRKDLKRIMRFETLGLYGIILFIPTLYIGIILFIYIQHGLLPIAIAVNLVLAYLIPIVLVGLITYQNYKKVIFNYIEGGH